MVAYLYNAPAGFAGAVTRPGESVVEPTTIGEAIDFGKPVKIVSGEAMNIDANDDAADFYGVLARSVPSLSSASDSDAASTDSICGILRRGYGQVVCATGTPARGGQVYMRVVTESLQLVGDFEATADNAITAGAMVGSGNATAGTLSVASDVVGGVYRALFTAPTAFNLVTPSGDILRVGATGAAYTAAGLTFTITVGGTPAAAGDYIDFTVVNNNVPLPGVTWAVDGVDADDIAELYIK
jgi:hypothetical protein